MQLKKLHIDYICIASIQLIMAKAEALEDFYRYKFDYLPFNLQQDIGHFNVFKIDDCVHKPVTYSRRDFYKTVRELQDTHQNNINGNQMNDPEKGAAVLISIAASKNPPLHLFLGQDAYDMAVQKIGEVRENLETYKPIITATGFDLATEA